MARFAARRTPRWGSPPVRAARCLTRRAAARRGAGPPREEPRQVLIDLDE
ncbi:hypothetical protein ACF09Y_02175 [Streptomyces massasporeus]